MEVWHNGTSIRGILGEHQILSLQNTRQSAMSFIHEVRQGKLNDQKKQHTLLDLTEQYLFTTRLKPNTINNYRHIARFYLSGWLNKRISSITRETVDNNFYEV